MSELKKKLDGARPHCLPRALVLINPGNPTGTLNVYRFVIRAVILMQMMMMMMMTIMMMMVMVIKFLYLLSTLFYHTVRLVRSSFLFTGCLLLKGVRYTKVLAIYIRRPFYRGVFFSSFF